MNRTGLTLLAAVCLSLLASAVAWTGESAGENDPALRLSAEFEGGKLYRAGKIGVVELTGSYRQMGRQYGTLLRGEPRSSPSRRN
jgi:hypothetical protein